jgi:hypothetical protein
MSEYVRFLPPRQLRDFANVPGSEPGGGMLSPLARDALAVALSRRRPPELVAIGQYVTDDGRAFLELGVTTAHVEATTDYRYDTRSHRLRRTCQECGTRDGRHKTGCQRTT